MSESDDKGNVIDAKEFTSDEDSVVEKEKSVIDAKKTRSGYGKLLSNKLRDHLHKMRHASLMQGKVKLSLYEVYEKNELEDKDGYTTRIPDQFIEDEEYKSENILVADFQRRYSKITINLQIKSVPKKSTASINTSKKSISGYGNEKTVKKSFQQIIGGDKKERSSKVVIDESFPSVITSRRSISSDVHLQFKTCSLECETFQSIEEFSQKFVDEVIQTGLDEAKRFQRRSNTKIIEGFEYNPARLSTVSSRTSTIRAYTAIFAWPTNSEFTPEIGKDKINEFLSYWKFEENWRYSTRFFEQRRDETCDYYEYETIFGIPCRQYPVPQATASIFFTFEISRVRPKECYVEVYFNLEGQRMKMTPTMLFYNTEKPLFDIIDAKHKLYKKINF